MKLTFFLTSLPLVASILLAPLASSKLAFNISPDFGYDVFVDWVALKPNLLPTSDIFADWVAASSAPAATPVAFGNDIFVDWVA